MKVMALIALAVLFTLHAASAAPAVTVAALSLKPSTGPPTAVVRATGTAFGAGEVVDLAFDTTPVGSTTTDANGGFATDFTVPQAATPGQHKVRAVGESSGLRASRTFTVRTDWPSHRYSAAKTGSNPYENLIDTGNVATLTGAWTSPVLGERADTSPVVVKGVAYVADHGPDVWAFDAATGAVRWHTIVPTVLCCSFSDLSVAGSVVYGAFSREIWALSTATGAVLWHTCDYQHGTCVFDTTIIDTPTVAGGKIFGGTNSGTLYALSASTGTPLWVDHLSGDLFDPIESSPAVDTVAKTLYVQDDANRFYAINSSNGKIRWTGVRAALTPPVGGFTSNTSAPALAGGKVFVASTVDDGNLTAFAAHGCGSPRCDPLWTASTHESGNPASPAAAGGTVYIPGENGAEFSMIAYDAATGTELWNSGVLPQGAFSAEGPSLENGVVYGGNANGAVYGFDAATGAQVWSAPTGGGGGSTTPVVVNGMVYAGNGNAQRLIAFKLP